MSKTRTITLAVLLALATLWIGMLVTDCWMVAWRCERPFFARCTVGTDDGGSGTYSVPGYLIELEGNFMPGDEEPGVTRAWIRVLGRELVEVSCRD